MDAEISQEYAVILKKILFTTEHPAPYMDDLFSALSEEFSVDVFYMESASSEKGWRSFSTSFSGHLAGKVSTASLVRMVRDADLVVVGGWARLFHIKTILISILVGTKVAIFSDAPNVSEKISLARGVQCLVLNFFPLFFVTGRHAGVIFANTYRIKDRVRIKDFPYQAWMPDPKVVSRFKKRRKAALENSDEPLRLFIANRFIKRKGYAEILEAFQHLHDIHLINLFRIDIAGDGPEINNFKSIFAEKFPNVLLHGWIDTELYRDLMLKCDIFVHASHFEPYGIPVIDACKCEKFVIATEGVCSAVDAIDAGYSVRLFPVGDGLGLGTLLEEAFHNRHSLHNFVQTVSGQKAFAPYRNLKSISEVLSSA